MSRFGKALSSTPVNIALFVIAAILLIGSVVGGTQAALSYFSDTYQARLQASSVGVTLVENGNDVAWRNYAGDGEWNQRTLEDPDTQELATLLQGEEFTQGSFKIGYEYPESLAVRNSAGEGFFPPIEGQIAEYVRVSVSKYWEDENGNKITTISPDLINVTYTEGNGWFEDEKAASTERRVFYYDTLLQPGQTTKTLTQSISVDPSILASVTEETKTENGVTTIKTTYDYNGARLCLEATAYAVQEHNAEDAIHSAWGTLVSVNNGKLSLR